MLSRDVRVVAWPLLALFGCASPQPAPTAAPGPTPYESREPTPRERAEYRDALRLCAAERSDLAARTPDAPRDDPYMDPTRIEKLETLLQSTAIDDPQHAALLDALLRRYVALEQIAVRDLKRSCEATEPTEGASWSQAARAIRSADAVRESSAAAALRTCARLRADHPRYEPHVPCPP